MNQNNQGLSKLEWLAFRTSMIIVASKMINLRQESNR